MGVFNIMGMGRIIYAVYIYIHLLAMSGSQAPRYPTIFPLGMGLCQFWQISSLKAGTKMLKVAAFAMPCWDAAGRPVVFLLGGNLGQFILFIHVYTMRFLPEK
jgi:hypothetical protein